jgi:hypothetical protein
MPFVVTKEQSKGGDKLYIQTQPDGEHLWTASKAKATPMSEAAADWLAIEINRFASVPCQVEGIKAEQEIA